ncbi:MAG: TonB-dependent receptor [Pseudomonadota bacterium]
MTRLPLACLPVALCAAAATAVCAQTTPPITLEEVVVSGGLTPIEADAFGRANSVVTAEDIEQRQIREVSEVLRALPGVAVSRSGGPGGLTQIRIRGSEANHVLVLIDGVEAAAPQNGEFDFGGLLAGDIERVEVLRGPQSALYGSNATAGVISITTKRGDRDGFSYGATLKGGTNETADVTAYIRGGTDRIDASFSVAARRDGGFDVSGDPGGEDDEDENITLNARFGADLAADVRLGGTFRFTDRESDFDQFNFGAADSNGLVSDADNFLRQREIFASFFADLEGFDGALAHGPRAEFTSVLADSFTSGAPTSSTIGERFSLGYEGTVALDGEMVAVSAHTLTLLGEFERETFENRDPALVFDPSQLGLQRRDLFGVAAEYRGAIYDGLDLQLSLRHDFNDAFNDATTFAAGLSYLYAPTGTRLRSSIGRGVTNPTFFEQFGFNPATFIGNPDLDPEDNFGFDVGVEQTFLNGRGVIDVTYFNETLDNEIVTNFDPNTFVATPVNAAGNSDRQGIEVTGTITPLEGLTFSATYTYTDSEDAAGIREVRRPEHEGSFRVEYTFLDGRVNIGGDMRFVIDNFDTDFTAASLGANQVALEDYAIFGLHGSYRFSENGQIFARIENLTDENYFEVDGFATRGITGFAGLRLTF